ncbi:hypothetical protein GCM10009682_56720 [Luedemannella flava]|uniref:Uncharacterized protein n=1 Tax=Luedemannella flava TaxID=349316 RepID=A0ABP4Z0Z2_9ACTN
MHFPPYLTAFGLTLLVEVPLYVAALTGLFAVRWRAAVVVALVANILTHLALWSVLRLFTGQPWYLWLVLAAEAGVCWVEYQVVAGGLARCRPARPPADRLELALVATVVVGVNGASVLAGAVAGLID